jgi:hypothetical protein
MLKSRHVCQLCLAAGCETVLTLCVVLLTLAVGRAAGAQSPTITTFDAPGAIATVPDALTTTGTITGFYFDDNFVAHGFLRTPEGHFVTFSAPGAGTSFYLDNGSFDGTFPLGINQFGAVVGYYNDANAVSHCFIRNVDGTISTFDAPGAVAGSQLVGINPLGLTVGNYTDSSGITHGFLRYPNGHFTSFDAAPGALVTFPNGPINLEGTVVGFYLDQNYLFHAFVRDASGRISAFVAPGSCTDGTPAGCYGNGDLNINVFGWSVGAVMDSNLINHGFLRSPDGKLTLFNAPGAGDSGPYQGTIWSLALAPDGNEVAGLNDLGAIAATYLDANDVYHGFLRGADGKFTSFDAPGADLTPGHYNGTFPVSINDLGLIAGYYADASGLWHGFIREPR